MSLFQFSEHRQLSFFNFSPYEKWTYNLNAVRDTLNKIKHIKKISPHKLDEIKNYLGEADLVINTAPINYNEDSNLKDFNNNFVESKNSYTPHGFDACYNYNTFFLDHFDQRKRFYGLHMLIHQAAPCFYKWYGVRPEIDVELVTLLETLLDEWQYL